MKPIIELINKDNPASTLAYVCAKCRRVHGLADSATRCCVFLCSECGADAPQYRTICDPCMAAARGKKALARFAKAKKVSLKDYPHDYVCADSSGDYVDVESVLDEPEEYDSYVWAVVYNPYPKPDAAIVIEWMCEEMHEDAHDDLDEAALQKLLDEWYEKQESRGFIEDNSRAVIIDEERAKTEMGWDGSYDPWS